MKKIIKKISMVSATVINFVYSKVYAFNTIKIDQPTYTPRVQETVLEASTWWYVMKMYIIPIIFIVISVVFYKKNTGSVLKKIITIIAIAIVLCLICCWLDNIIIQEKLIYMYT